MTIKLRLGLSASIAAAVAFALFGCAENNFSKFYQPISTYADQADFSDISAPQILRGGDPKGDMTYLLENGYVPIGFSSFNAPPQNMNTLTAEAKQVKAAIVVWYSAYTNTISGSMPLVVPNNQTSYTNMSGTETDMYGTTNLYGTATTTTYGSKTLYIPYNINRYDYLAAYWAKAKPYGFGAYSRDLTDAERQSLGSNRGAYLSLIVKGSPAFNADFLPGDIVTEVNGVQVTDAQDFIDELRGFAGQSVSITFSRNNQAETKTLVLGQSNDDN